MLKEGSLAPDFSLLDSEGKMHTISGLKGKSVILYFYPKDDTPGCTKEACDFRDNFQKLTILGCSVIGVSKDNAISHQKFQNKYNINFALLSDIELKAHHAYNIIENGKTIRSTFLIDKNGYIAKIWHKVNVNGHSDEVLSAVEELN